jgi:hypothetical protein
MSHTGVVNDNIEPAEAILNGLHHRPHLRITLHIGLQGQRLDAALLDLRRQRFRFLTRFPVVYYDARSTGLRQRAHHCATDASGATGH